MANDTMTNDQLNKITDFFHPNRQVWQNAEEPGSSNIDADAESDAGSNADTDSDTDFFDTESVPDKEAEDDKIDAASDFADQVCDFVKKEGGSAKTIAEKQVCSMKSELDKIKDLKPFIDELYEKFLRHKDEKDTFQRFEALESECDIERIIKCFDRGVAGHAINIYTDKQLAENPNLIDHIVFTYKDGTTEIINLELTEEERLNMILPVIQELKEAKAEADKEAARANQQEAEQRWRDSHPISDSLWEKWREKYEDTGGEKPSEEKQQPSEQYFSDLYSSDEYYDAFKIEEEQTRQE